MALLYKMPKSEKGDNSMEKTCEPNIMILAKTVLQIYCGQDCFTAQNAKVEMGDNSAK